MQNFDLLKRHIVEDIKVWLSPIEGFWGKDEKKLKEKILQLNGDFHAKF